VEQIDSNLQDTSNQSPSSVVKTKTSAAALLSFRCSMAGFFIFFLIIILDLLWGVHGSGMMNIVYPVLSIISFALSAIGLVCGIIGLIRGKVISGMPRGSGYAIIGLIIGVALMIVWIANIIDREKASKIKPYVEVFCEMPAKD
jgi:hypothetical protein